MTITEKLSQISLDKRHEGEIESLMLHAFVAGLAAANGYQALMRRELSNEDPAQRQLLTEMFIKFCDQIEYVRL